MTTLDNCTGRWKLAAFGSISHTDVETTTQREDDVDAWASELTEICDDWLDDTPDEMPELDEAEGLTLEVADDGSFEESGNAPVEFISADGVLGDGSDAFPGTLEEHDGRVFAFTDEERYDTRRVSDGDTDVSDEFLPDGDELVRVVSMVTDGMYRDRFVYRYARA